MHFVERLERAIDEAAALEVEAEAQQDVGVLDLGQLRPLQQRLVHLDGARDLAALAMTLPRIRWISSASLSTRAAWLSSSIARSIWFETRKFRPST